MWGGRNSQNKVDIGRSHFNLQYEHYISLMSDIKSKIILEK